MNMYELGSSEAKNHVEFVDVSAENVLKSEPVEDEKFCTVDPLYIAQDRKFTLEPLDIDDTTPDLLENEDQTKIPFLGVIPAEVKSEPKDEFSTEQFIVDIPNIDYDVKAEQKDEDIIGMGSSAKNSISNEDNVSIQTSSAGDNHTAFNGVKMNSHFQKKFSLIKHIGTQANKKPFKCSECEYSAATKDYLTRHMFVHNGEKPFKCSECEYSTVIKNKLRRHMLVHTAEKPNKCSECDFSATQKYQLLVHLSVHTGEKPFKCSECEYSAATKVYLTRHMLVHNCEKPFKCSECDYSTGVKNRLLMHMSVHNGEKPFKCSECEYSTIKKGNLTRHMLVHIGEKSCYPTENKLKI